MDYALMIVFLQKVFPDDQKKIDELLKKFPKKRELALDLIDRGFSVDRIWDQFNFEEKEKKVKR